LVGTVKVPLKAKYVVSRHSPETSDNLRPSSVKKEIPVEFIGRSVSKAKGWNVCEAGSDKYFADFLAPACSAAPPGLAEKTQPVC